MHQTYNFSIAFLEISNADRSERRNPITYDKVTAPPGRRKFGAKLKASFLPQSPGEPEIRIRESTASLVFDTLEVADGTYWNMYSIGDYFEANSLERMGEAKG